MTLPRRYEGKPLLIVIENYALAVIGTLDDKKAANVRDIVNRVWGGADDWMATVREQLGWEPSMDQTIRRNWAGYQKAAREQGVPGSATEFAMIFADAIERQASG